MSPSSDPQRPVPAGRFALRVLLCPPPFRPQPTPLGTGPFLPLAFARAERVTPAPELAGDPLALLHPAQPFQCTVHLSVMYVHD